MDWDGKLGQIFVEKLKQFFHAVFEVGSVVCHPHTTDAHALLTASGVFDVGLEWLLRTEVSSQFCQKFFEGGFHKKIANVNTRQPQALCLRLAGADLYGRVTRVTRRRCSFFAQLFQSFVRKCSKFLNEGFAQVISFRQ